jgi:cation:H+ antiporter
LSALVSPLIVSQQLVKLDVPIMIMLSAILLVLAWDRQISRLDGFLLFGGLIVYTWFTIRQSRREKDSVKQEYEQEFGAPGQRSGKRWMTNIFLIAAGLALLIIGSGWLVDSATKIAKLLGVSDLVIGLTIIAAGTSLPEVVTSVIATLRGERDIAVGNIVGSNLFNIMAVLGLASIVADNGIAVPSSVINFDLPVMIAVAFACLPIFFTDGAVSRWEGGLLLAYYCAYTLYLILAATHHAALPLLSGTMLYFVIPLTILTLAIVTVSAVRAKG